LCSGQRPHPSTCLRRRPCRGPIHHDQGSSNPSSASGPNIAESQIAQRHGQPQFGHDRGPLSSHIRLEESRSLFSARNFATPPEVLIAVHPVRPHAGPTRRSAASPVSSRTTRKNAPCPQRVGVDSHIIEPDEFASNRRLRSRHSVRTSPVDVLPLSPARASLDRVCLSASNSSRDPIPTPTPEREPCRARERESSVGPLLGDQRRGCVSGSSTTPVAIPIVEWLPAGNSARSIGPIQSAGVKGNRDPVHRAE